VSAVFVTVMVSVLHGSGLEEGPQPAVTANTSNAANGAYRMMEWRADFI
jgi:hypothetical protein